MKLRHPWLIRIAGIFGGCIVRCLMNTVQRRDDLRALTPYSIASHRRHCILAFWHESILASTLFRGRVSVLISQHADGELIAQVCRFMRYGTVRGSTNRGGAPALMEMIKAGRKSHLAITPDGPRGPRRRVQPGTIFLASQTGLPLIGFGVGYTNVWRARSWDHFAAPKPFSSVYIVGAAPMMVPAGLDQAGIEFYRRELENRLNDATEDAERRANDGLRLQGKGKALTRIIRHRDTEHTEECENQERDNNCRKFAPSLFE